MKEQRARDLVEYKFFAERHTVIPRQARAAATEQRGSSQCCYPLIHCLCCELGPERRQKLALGPSCIVLALSTFAS